MSEIQFNGSSWEIKEALQAFYTPYASYVIQSRALPDARDGLKCGARFILYSQYKDKLTCKEKRRKAVATINAAMRFSPHGDASILGTAVRLSQDFSLRYPIIEVQGNNGSYISGDDYSQSRYLEMRGNEIAWEMTNLLAKETIPEWKMNYTNEEQYPIVLPTKFPYSLVNGSYGIGVACASSIPPHNLKDVCNALILLLQKPEATFEELYCPIDFPTGGIIINEEQVKESLKVGNGKAAIVRAVVEYDDKLNELVVKELPYMTFTSNITKSINKAIEEGLLPSIEGIIDETDFEGCKISIQLKKNANINRTLKLLYRHTLLQNSYSINMNMLENGKIPKLFGWKESLEAYLHHLRDVIVRAYNFDLDKLEKRIHILEGYIIAFQNLDEVIKLIRSTPNENIAKQKLMEQYSLSETQAKSILDMKLSKLTSLEIEKLEKEHQEKTTEANRIKTILSSEENIKQDLIKQINELKEKYGDERRTKNINLEFTGEDETEPVEEKQLLIHYTNQGNLYTQISTTLLCARKGNKGSKVKLAKNEVITQTLSNNNFGCILAFSNKGNMYSTITNELPIDTKVNVNQLFELKDGEKITALTSISRRDEVDYFVFITKNGLIKKTAAKEYDKQRGKSIKAINLKDDDEVVSVHFVKDENIGILTKNGNFVIIETKDVTATARATMGIKAIKLAADDNIISSQPISGKYLITISQEGLIKKTELSEFPVCNRGIKGKRISGVKENDFIVKFLTLSTDCDIITISNKGTLKFNTSELRILSRDAVGVKAMKLPEGSKVVDLVIA